MAKNKSPKRGRPPKDLAGDVQARILDAAQQLFLEKGFRSASIDDISELAPASKPTIYAHFPGKEALFAELVRRFSPFEPIAAVLETMGERPPAEVIPAVAQAMAAAMDGHIGLLLQLLFELSRSDPDRHGGADANQDAAQAMRTLPLVAHYLDQQMAAGRLRRMDPVLAVQSLIGPIVMHLLARSQAGSQSGPDRGMPLALEAAVGELVGLWLRAMTPGDGGHQRQQPRSRPGSNHDG